MLVISSATMVNRTCKLKGWESDKGGPPPKPVTCVGMHQMAQLCYQFDKHDIWSYALTDILTCIIVIDIPTCMCHSMLNHPEFKSALHHLRSIKTGLLTWLCMGNWKN